MFDYRLESVRPQKSRGLAYVTPTGVPAFKLTGAEYVRVAFKTWRANTSESAGKIFAECAAAAGCARALVVVAAAHAWVPLVAGRAAALVAALQIAANCARPASVRVQALVQVNTLIKKLIVLIIHFTRNKAD